MMPQLTALDPVTHSQNAKTILAKDGFRCSLQTLAPGDELPCRDAGDREEHLLFVVDGEATVRAGEVNTILGKDGAMLVPTGKGYVLAASPGGWAKILRIDVPPRQIVTPQILSFDR